MTIANSSSARRAGFKINDETIGELAALSMAKIGCRTLYVPLPADCWHMAGASVAVAEDGIFPIITLPDANTGNLYTSFELPAEAVLTTGTYVLSIYWKSTAVSGAAKYTVELASRQDNGNPSTAEETLTVTTTVATTASQINKSQITFLGADFSSANNLVGIHVSRDPADAADTLGANVSFVCAVLEFTGRG